MKSIVRIGRVVFLFPDLDLDGDIINDRVLTLQNLYKVPTICGIFECPPELYRNRKHTDISLYSDWYFITLIVLFVELMLPKSR